MSDEPGGATWFSGVRKRQRLPGEHYLLLSEGSDAGTPILLSEGSDAGTPIEVGEQYE